MLVLTRRAGQKIIIYNPKTDETIEVTITEVRGDQVRIGTAAPEDVKVHRKEIYDQIQQENRASAASAKPDLASSGALSTLGKTLDQIRAMQRPS